MAGCILLSMAAAVAAGFNLRPLDHAVAASFDETIDDDALAAIIGALGGRLGDDYLDSAFRHNLAETARF